MARRTRRNLSNSKIKRIVRHQLQSSQSHVALGANPPFSNLLKKLFLPLLVVLFVFLGYSLTVNSDLQFGSLFDDFSNSQSPTDLHDEAKAVATEKEIVGTVPNEAEENRKALIQPVQQKLQVEVLNACGASGIASTVTKYLRDQDIDVVNMGNYTRFDLKKTVLWERVKDTDSKKIAQLLGVSNDNIESRMDPNLQLDITIILGADYASLMPFKN